MTKPIAGGRMNEGAPEGSGSSRQRLWQASSGRSADIYEGEKLMDHKLTRRDFLATSAGVGAGLCVGLGTPFSGLLRLDEAAAQNAGLELFREGYPRAFSFRQSESSISNGLSYAEWELGFLPLNGIMGKALPNERRDRVDEKQIEYFTRFKTSHPEKAVFLHFNGTGRDPGFDPEGFFAGHWLYKAGTRLTETAAADRNEDVLHVADPAIFGTNIGRHDTRNNDIGVCLVGEDGKPDWSRAEQVKLVSVDRENGTIIVERGSYGTEPITLPENSYIAHHEVSGPWCPGGEGCGQLWSYNFSTFCPKDSWGRNCTDALVEDLAGKFGPGGVLSAFDGIQFDIFFFTVEGPPNSGRSLEADADADGLADAGIVDGVNTYGLGTLEFTKKLRERLPDKVIMADGHYIKYPVPWDEGTLRHQRSFATLNGIETEGFLNARDHEIQGWSEGLNIFNFWKQNSAQPPLNYVNYKYNDGNMPSYNRFRLVLAGAQFADAALSYSSQPDRGERRIRVWDELWLGVEHKPNWLGMPMAPAVHLARQTPDLLRGAGVAWVEDFVERFQGTNVRFERQKGGGTPPRMVVASADSGANTSDLNRVTTFSLPGIDLPKEDLFVTLRLKADPLGYYPASAGRYLKVTASPSGTEDPKVESATWVNEESFDAFFYFRDIGPGPVDLRFEAEGYAPVTFEQLRAYSSADATYREFEHGVVFANPSTRPYTFDVANLFPDASFRRIRGSEEQDPETNNGAPLGEALTVGPIDALFVARE